MKSTDDLVEEYLSKANPSLPMKGSDDEDDGPSDDAGAELSGPGAEDAKAKGGGQITKLPPPSIHENKANLHAALSKISHLGEKGFRSLHPGTQKELLDAGMIDASGYLTAQGHQEISQYFAQHAQNPKLGPEAQQSAATRHQAHAEAAGQGENAHEHWKSKQVEMKGGQPQPGAQPGMQPGMPPKPPMVGPEQALGAQLGDNKPPMPMQPGMPLQGAPNAAQMQGAMGKPGMPGVKPPMGQGAPVSASAPNQAPENLPPNEGAPTARGMVGKPPMQPGKPAQGMMPPHEPQLAKPGMPAQAMPPAGQPGVPPKKPVPPQFQKSMSGLDALGDYLEKAGTGGERTGHKYIRRTGIPGRYQYVYAQGHDFKAEHLDKLPAGSKVVTPHSQGGEVHYTRQENGAWHATEPDPEKEGAAGSGSLGTHSVATVAERMKQRGGTIHTPVELPEEATGVSRGKKPKQGESLKYRKGITGEVANVNEHLTINKLYPDLYMVNVAQEDGKFKTLSAHTEPEAIRMGMDAQREPGAKKPAGKQVHPDTHKLVGHLKTLRAGGVHTQKVGQLASDTGMNVDRTKAAIADLGYEIEPHPEHPHGQVTFDRQAGKQESPKWEVRDFLPDDITKPVNVAHLTEQSGQSHEKVTQALTEMGYKINDKGIAQKPKFGEKQETAKERMHREAGQGGGPTDAERAKALSENKAALARYKQHLAALQHGHRHDPTLPKYSIPLIIDTIHGLEAAIANQEKGLKPTGEKKAPEGGKYLSHPDVQKYIRAIRNPAKKAYAQAYAKWKDGGEQGAEPEHKPLSYMAAQAVRLHMGNVVTPRQKMEGISGFQTPVKEDAPTHPKASPEKKDWSERAGIPYPEKLDDLWGEAHKTFDESMKMDAKHHEMTTAGHEPDHDAIKRQTAKVKALQELVEQQDWSKHPEGQPIFRYPTAGQHYRVNTYKKPEPEKEKPAKPVQGDLFSKKPETTIGVQKIKTSTSGSESQERGIRKQGDNFVAVNGPTVKVFSSQKGAEKFMAGMGYDAQGNPLKKSDGISELGAYLRKSVEQIPGGLASGKSPSDFDPKALAQGIKVEMEHTKSKKVAQEIAMDHLTEDGHYYAKLAKMEKSVTAEINALLQRDPHPDDTQVHALAGKLGMKVDDLEERIYAMAGKAKRMEKCAMRKSGLGELGDYLNKADGMPDQNDWDEIDKPVETTLGGSANGGDLTETPTPTGNGGSAAGEGQDAKGQLTGVNQGEQEILGDDRDPAKQMTPGTAALEDEIPEGYKSLTPASQRAMVAKETAQHIAKLQKSNDVHVGFVHPLSMASIHGNTDAEAEALLKSDFYHGASPTLALPGSVLRQNVLCKSEGCGCRYSAMLTACPGCGEGTVVNRMLPRSAYMGGGDAIRLEKSACDPILKPRPVEEDVRIEGPSPVVFRKR